MFNEYYTLTSKVDKMSYAKQVRLRDVDVVFKRESVTSGISRGKSR